MALNSLLLTVSDPSLEPAAVESRINKASDWLRYSPGCWIVLTRRDAKFWYQVLSDVPEIDQSLVFVSEINLANKSGQLSPEAWAWLKAAEEKVAAESAKDEAEWVAAATPLSAGR